MLQALPEKIKITDRVLISRIAPEMVYELPGILMCWKNGYLEFIVSLIKITETDSPESVSTIPRGNSFHKFTIRALFYSAKLTGNVLNFVNQVSLPI